MTLGTFIGCLERVNQLVCLGVGHEAVFQVTSCTSSEPEGPKEGLVSLRPEPKPEKQKGA